MKHLDLTLPAPAENLACDEALLDAGEDGSGGEVLRFWEAREPFVVVGYANRVAREVNVAACEARNIPVYRRCSGGGTVWQGPGCLNYALVLRIAENGQLAGIATANRFIMERNRAAVEAAFRTRPPATAVCGHTDLAIGGRKFSGNSQRRHRRFLLFHGSFLLHADLAAIGELLPMPSHQPDYRKHRSHAEFLTNLNLAADEVKSALKKIWDAGELLPDPPLARIAALAREKYTTRSWNYKF